MSKPCETLKNWTHWGVMGVINPGHSAGDCQNESHLPPLLRAPQYCIFSPGSRRSYSMGESNWVEFDSTSMARKCYSVSRREVNRGRLRFSSMWAVNCSWKYNSQIFLSSRGLVRSGRADIAVQTPAPLLAIIRVSQGEFVKGKEAVNPKWEGWIAVNGARSCQQPVTYIWKTPWWGFHWPVVTISSRPPGLLPFLVFCLPLFHINSVESSISYPRSPHKIWLQSSRCHRKHNMKASLVFLHFSETCHHMSIIVAASSDQWRRHRASLIRPTEGVGAPIYTYPCLYPCL